MNWTDENGCTLLHYAAAQCHKEIAELLIAKGADVNAKNGSGPNQGESPLDNAISYNYFKTENLLRKHGAKTGEESYRIIFSSKPHWNIIDFSLQ